MKRHVFLASVLLVAALWGQAAAGEAASGKNNEAEFQEALAEGAQFLKEGGAERALARFKMALKLKPDDARGYYWVGLTYSELNNYGLAATNAEKATIIDDKYSDAWMLWGQCLTRMSRWEDAREKLEHAFTLSPNDYLIPFTLGLCYYYGLDNQSKATALKYFKRALELNGNYVPARLYEGCCYLDAGLTFLAVISFKNVLKQDPGNAEGWFRLGLAHRQDNHVADAEKAFLQTVTVDARFYEAELQLGHLYQIDLLDKKKAAARYQKFLTAAPENHPWRAAVLEYLATAKE